MGYKQKFQSKLATHWGAWHDPEIGKDVWPHYALENAVRETMIVMFAVLNLSTYAVGMGEGLNTGLLPTGLSTTRAILVMAIFLFLYPKTVKTLATAMEKLPVVKYREDLDEETDSENTVVKYVEKKYDGES